MMRALLFLALFLPSLALAAPDAREWSTHTGSRVDVVYIDGSRVTGTVVAVEGEQVRLRKDDGAVTMVPMSVVSAIQPRDEPAPGGDPSGPPPPAPAPPSRPGIGIGVGVGMGPVSIGVGGSTGGSVAPTGPSIGGHYKRNIVGVRYPMRGGETVDYMLFDDRGGSRPPPEDLEKSRVLREYVFVDEWGQSVPWQTAWAAMGAERDYIDEVKRIDRTMVPLKVAENGLAIGGIALIVWGFIADGQDGQINGDHPALIAGSICSLGSIALDIGVVGPTRNRLRAQLGRKSLDRAQQHFANQ